MNSLRIGDVEITWLGHASFRINGSKVVYIDPFMLPQKAEKADIILVTHDHFDHLDGDKIKSIATPDTKIFASESAIAKLPQGRAMRPGDHADVGDVRIEAVHAYNTTKFREPGKPFHPKGFAVGFVVTIDGKRIYHAGDTDDINEMASLRDIDVALLPIGGTYTMTVDEAASAAKKINAKIVVPMHYNSGKYGVEGISADPKALAKKVANVKILIPLV